VRRADGASRQDHLARRIGPLDDPVARELDAGRTLAVEQDAVDQRVGDELEIRALQRRPEIGARGAGEERRGDGLFLARAPGAKGADDQPGAHVPGVHLPMKATAR
jgi:hypothetical protein